MELQEFADRIPSFSRMMDNQKIGLLIWYMLEFRGVRRVQAPDIKWAFDELHIQQPSNLHQSLRRLTEVKNPPLLGDATNGYYLERGYRQQLDTEYGKFVKTPKVEVSDTVLPASMVAGTRKYLEQIVRQINGCYQVGFYDGCAVLMRRLVESLLIDVFLHAKKENEIKTGGEYMMLQGILSVVKSKQHVHLPRGSDDILEQVKYVGDRAAHNRAYITNPKDIDEITPRFRTLISDLLHAADIHPKPA